MNAISESSVEGKEAYLAELRTLRAYYYFDLIRIFERIPYITEKSDAKTVRFDEFTRDEIFGFIKDDLKYAWENLPESQVAAGRVNKFVAAAIMAKVCAFTSDWNDVITYSDYVINSHKYELYNNYLDMWKI